MSFIPRPKSVGDRKAARRSLRIILGRTGDPAPDAADAIRAALQLNAILDAATDGVYRLSIVENSHFTARGVPVGFQAALREARHPDPANRPTNGGTT